MDADTYPSLEDRVAAALRDGHVDAEQVSDLANEAQSAIVTAGKTAEMLRVYALSPTLSKSQVAQARQQMEAAAFERERLQTAAQRLHQRVDELRAQAEDHRRRKAYDQVKAERDKLAQELAKIYPALEQQLVDLLGRIVANDREIETANMARPSGAETLLPAELVARRMIGFRPDGLHNVPRITEQLRLPAFTWDAHHPFAWPGTW